MAENSYREQFDRLAQALERCAEGASKPLKGKRYSLKSDDAIILAITEIITVLGGEVTNEDA